MNVKAGLWIDHRRALIVMTFEGGEKELEILSHVDSQPGREERVRADARFEPRMVQADESREKARNGQLNRFYAEVVKVIRDAESILIIGPGEAKEDLRKHLERARLGDRVAGMEPAGRMTAHQIAAKVREHSHHAH